jgi:hypothetical protein
MVIISFSSPFHNGTGEVNHPGYFSVRTTHKIWVIFNAYQHETYIGTATEGEQKAGLLRAQIEEVKALLPDLRCRYASKTTQGCALKFTQGV